MATTVPYHFYNCPMEHMVTMVADMLERLLRHNDQIPLSPEALTRFHSRTAPSISVHDYLRRVVRYTNLEASCLLITLHYIDQMCRRLPRFTISSLTVHRFIIASVCVSTKALCDAFCTNSHYAKIGGIRVTELNVLEREFLANMDWRLITYYVNLARSHSAGAFKVADPPTPAVAGASSPSSSSVPSSSPRQAEEEDPDWEEDPEGSPTSNPSSTATVSEGRASSHGVSRSQGSGSDSSGHADTTTDQGAALSLRHNRDFQDLSSHNPLSPFNQIPSSSSLRRDVAGQPSDHDRHKDGDISRPVPVPVPPLASGRRPSRSPTDPLASLQLSRTLSRHPSPSVKSSPRTPRSGKRSRPLSAGVDMILDLDDHGPGRRRKVEVQAAPTAEAAG